MDGYRSGFVVLLGRPNAGKSTLMNRLIGEKIAIVSDKPQTTRNRIQGVLTVPGEQIVFLDTPGIHKPKHLLGSRMVRTALDTLNEVDLILLMIDASVQVGKGDKFVITQLAHVETPIILVLNKMDQTSPVHLQAVLAELLTLRSFSHTIAISASTGENTDELLGIVRQYLPLGPQYYPEDSMTDQPERLVVAEFVREKVLELTRDEIPHSVAVGIERMQAREDGLVEVDAIIYVERDSQKGIIIGAKGQMIKEIGTLARKDIELLLGSQIFLQLWVKVKNDWRDREDSLRQLGYE